MNTFKSWEHVRDYLASGQAVFVRWIWYVTASGYVCADGCCDDAHDDLDDALDTVMNFSGNDLSQVRID